MLRSACPRVGVCLLPHSIAEGCQKSVKKSSFSPNWSETRSAEAGSCDGSRAVASGHRARRRWQLCCDYAAPAPICSIAPSRSVTSQWSVSWPSATVKISMILNVTGFPVAGIPQNGFGSPTPTVDSRTCSAPTGPPWAGARPAPTMVRPRAGARPAPTIRTNPIQLINPEAREFISQSISGWMTHQPAI